MVDKIRRVHLRNSIKSGAEKTAATLHAPMLTDARLHVKRPDLRLQPMPRRMTMGLHN